MSTERYSRQTRVAGIGESGQQALQRATVLIVGVGALGTHAASALARAGVGRLWLCDRDVVELSNLQRQQLFSERDAEQGTPKAVAAAARLQAVNSGIEVQPFVADCTVEFLRALPALPDVVLDGTDNFATRYLLNDYAVQQQRPWIYAGAVGAEGAAMVIRPSVTGCLRCLWPQPPSPGEFGTCETVGILSPAIAAVSAFQVSETLKLLTGAEPCGGVFHCNIWLGQYAVTGGSRPIAEDCPSCVQHVYPALQQGAPVAVTLCGRDAVQVDPPRRSPVDLALLQQRLQPAVQGLQRTAHLLRFEVEGCSFRVFPGGRALLFGVSDPLRARALYDRYVGAS